MNNIERIAQDAIEHSGSPKSAAAYLLLATWNAMRDANEKTEYARRLHERMKEAKSYVEFYRYKEEAERYMEEAKKQLLLSEDFSDAAMHIMKTHDI